MGFDVDVVNMGDVTPRDRVWAAALEVAEEEMRFQTRHVYVAMGDPPSHKTIQRTLRAMSDLDILTHSKGSRYYRSSPKMRKIRSSR